MKKILIVLACMFSLSIARAGTPAATAIDTIAVMTLPNGTVVLTAYSAIYVITLSTTPDTVTLPAAARVIEIIGQGAATDTGQIALAQPTTGSGVVGVPKYSEWILGNATDYIDFQQAVIKKLYWKAKSGTCKLWIRVFTWKP